MLFPSFTMLLLSSNVHIKSYNYNITVVNIKNSTIYYQNAKTITVQQY